jgi:predicted HNH restriction endonuclease
MEKACKHHGLTKFSLQKSNGRETYYCVKCYMERQNRTRNNKKEQALTYKGGKCSICGYDKCSAALDFHHLNPLEKESKNDLRNLSWDRLKIELDKCILVCANCHREIHFK